MTSILSSVAPHALFSPDEIPSNAHCSIRIDVVETCRSRHMNFLCFQSLKFDPHSPPLSDGLNVVGVKQPGGLIPDAQCLSFMLGLLISVASGTF